MKVLDGKPIFLELFSAKTEEVLLPPACDRHCLRSCLHEKFIDILF